MKWFWLATLVAACTFTYVEGNNNRFSDLGGDVARPPLAASGAAINPRQRR